MMEHGIGWGMGCGWPGMILFRVVSLLVVLAVAAAAIKYLIGPRAPRSNTGMRDDKNRALEVLEEKYARGEINREGFLQKRDDLRGH